MAGCQHAHVHSRLGDPEMMRGQFVLAFLVVAFLTGCSEVDEEDLDLGPSGGAELYRLHCASCHGADARGKGPVAPYLNVQVPDLTLIRERHGGAFAPEEIFKIIDGQSSIAAHGPRHMPVWGYEFFGPQDDDRLAHAQATERIDRVVSYLGRLQRTR
jgi:mono/diheme cytochrome c family protein